MNNIWQNQEIIQRIIVSGHRSQTDRLVFIIFGSTESYIIFSMKRVIDIHCVNKNKDP